MSIDQLFFQLLQVAIGNRKSLDRMPSTEEWVALFDMAKKQALTAIAFTGVTKLNPGSDFGTSLGIPEDVYLKWLGLTAKVAQRNKELNAECAKVCAELAHDGLQCCVLKGQSNLVNYPEELREYRTAGDIDLWTLPANQTGIARVIEYAQQWRISHNQEPIPWNRILYYHVEMDTDSGTEVELHYRPSFLCSPLRNMRLQRWFKENEQFETLSSSPCLGRGPSLNGSNSSSGSNIPLSRGNEGVFPIPTVSFNVVYQLLHIYKHLFEEGIGLRQLLDYYFVLKTLSSSPCVGGESRPDGKSLPKQGGLEGLNEEIMHTLSRFGMKKFAGAVMYVLAQVFDPREDIKTKTIKTPSSMSGSTNLSLEESSVASENKLSASTVNSSNGILTDAAIADGDKQFINPQPSTLNLHPWMICEPNEKEGKFLLNEIMRAGNFGKYDTRISHSTSQMGHAWEKLKHNMRLVRHYPEEVLCEPFFRIYHYFWRRFSLWRY